jgi:phospholipid/cholesterol/gamma-HCH transport system substrate-binding protein
MFDVQVGTHKPKLVRNGAIFCLIAMIFLWIIYTKPSIPFLSGGGRTVSADFAYAADVVPGRTPVREYGVEVGTVTGVERNPNGPGVRVAMSIMPDSGVNLRSDASASLRWRTLLGLNYYVDLIPGSPSAPPLENATIPENHTSSQVELDQVLEPLNGQGRQALGTMIDQFDVGFSDPAAVRSTLHSAAPAMQNLAAGLPGLRGTDPGKDLPQLIAGSSRWMGALAADDATLGDMVANGATALGVTAANRIALGATFDTAPDALLQTQATMVRLRATLNTLDPIARQLEPGARKLYRAATMARTALDAATPLLATLKPTLAAIRPSVDSLATTARAGVPVINDLTPVLDRTLNTYIPWLNSSDPETKLKEYEAIGPAVASVSSVLGYGDQYGTLAGFEAGVGENVIGGQSPCSTFIANPTVPLTEKVDCQALTQLLTSIFTGSAPVTPLRNSPISANLVDSLLKTGKP